MNTKHRRLEDSRLIRWSALLTISFVIFSSYYFYDVFSGIKESLNASLNFSNSDYGLMLGFYSTLNIFILLVSGVLTDKWGIRNTGVLFTSFIMLGAFITVYGTSQQYLQGGYGYYFLSSFFKSYSPELKMMMLGRLLFGSGAETLIIISSKIMVKWFKGKELALAFGINLAIARMGSIGALWLSPYFDSKGAWESAIQIGAILIAISFLIYLLYCFFDFKYDKQSAKPGLTSDDEEIFRYHDIILLFKNRSFLFITALCVLFYSAVFPFLFYTPDLLHNKFEIAKEYAGRIASIIYFGTIFFTPLFGWLVDKKGKSATLMIIGSILLIAIHLTLSLTNFYPYIPLFLLGVSFSLVPAAMWPAVSKIVKHSTLGTAYGVMTSIQNIGLLLFPWLIGLVLDKTNPGVTSQMVNKGIGSYDYTYAILMLALLGIVGFLFAILLKRENNKAGFGLERPFTESK